MERRKAKLGRKKRKLVHGIGLTLSVDKLEFASCFRKSDVDGFISNFREVWSSIPRSQKIKLKKHWRWFMGVYITEIERGMGYTAYYTDSSDGCCFVFNLDNLVMPDDYQKFLIAHELGHAISYSEGWMDEHRFNLQECSRIDGLPSCDICEEYADKFAKELGFARPNRFD